jgi:hypothetical protein
MSRSYRADDRYTTTADRQSRHAYDPACTCTRCERAEHQHLRTASHQAQPTSEAYRLTIGGQVHTVHARHNSSQGDR